MTIERQLQFPFMREINLRYYLLEQREFFKERFDLYCKSPDKLYTPKFGDFLEAAILGGLAEQYQRQRYKKYFGDDEDIVHYD